MFLVVQNDRNCPAGMLHQVLEAARVPYRTVCAFAGDAIPDASGLTAAVVLGGEMGAHDTERHPHLARVIAFMREAVGSGLPLLGICLGGQLLAHACGGTVNSPSRHRERGIHRVDLTAMGAADPLFAGVSNPFVTFQLHNDSFTTPPGATLLASSPACPAQAFRLPGRVYGVQFHPEVDRSIVDLWDGFFTPRADHLSGFIAAEESFNAASRTILANFVSLSLSPAQP